MAKKIILDTDLGGDCDDAGALAVLFNLRRRGAAEIDALTYCISNLWGARFIHAQQTYYGCAHIPLGVLKDPGLLAESLYERFTRPYVERHWPGAYPDFPDATRLLRRTLAENGRRDMTLAAIGPLRNIANLFASGPDDISPKTGLELAAENLEELVIMAGDFARPEVPEWNVKIDIPAAQAVVERCPVPLTFCAYEIGETLLTGHSLAGLPDNHPVRAAYLGFNRYLGRESHLRSSWDLVTAYYAVMGAAPYWRLEENLRVSIRNDGSHTQTPGGNHRYLVQLAGNDVIAAVLNSLMV